MNSVQSDDGMLVLGVDGGGSKCKARLESGCGEFLGSGVAGPANPFQNLAQAKASIVEAALSALDAAGRSPDALGTLAVGIGLAGVNVPRFRELMEAWDHPFNHMCLTTDIHIACLAAHGGEDGAVIVMGTGSVGFVSSSGESYSLGGHGFPFGDKGSGAWLGLEATKAALLALDGLGPDTGLVAALEQQLSVRGLALIDALAEARARDYAVFAPLVLAQAAAGDAVATAIVQDGSRYLDAMARNLLSAGTDKLALLGGLSHLFTPWLADDVAIHLVTPQGQPDEGAVRFARAELLERCLSA